MRPVLTCVQCISGLRGYLITKAGAEALLTAAMPLNTAIDKQVRLAYGTSLYAYCARPSLVAHNDKIPQLRAAFDAPSGDSLQ
jgi:hypothetical protein